MAAPKIRSDYDQLNQIGQRFGQEGESTRQLIQSLRQNVDTLRGGDWIGPGATAFYAEMDGSVMPSLKRLAAAMDSAKQASGQIRQLIQQAEGEASGQLRRDQSGGGGGGGAGGGGSAGGGMPDPSQLFNNLDGGGGNVGMPDPSQLFNNLDGGDSGGSAGGGGGGDLPDGVPTNPGAAFDILDGNDPNYEYGTGQQGSGDLPDGVPTNPEAAFDRLDSDADPNYQYGQSGQQGSQSDAFTPVGQGDTGSGAAVGQTGGGGSQSGGGSPSGGGSSGGGSPSGGGGSPPPAPLDEKNKKLLKALKKILSKMGDKVDEAQIPAEMKGLFKDFAALKDLVDDD